MPLYEPLGCSFGVCVVGTFKIKTARKMSIRTDHIGSVVYSYYSYTAFLFLVLFMSSQDFQNPRELSASIMTSLKRLDLSDLNRSEPMEP